MAVAGKPRGSSRTEVFFIQVAYLFLLGAFVISYRVAWIEPRRDFFGPVPFLVPWFGAVGAVLLSLKGVFDHRFDWDPEYRFWHWSRPFIGGVVSTVSVLIFQSGILAVGGQLPNHATTDTAKNLFYYVVAFVVGYREDVFRDLIKRAADILLTPPPEEVAPPAVKSITPPQAAAGTKGLVVLGSGFTGATSVKVDGKEADFVVKSDTELSVDVPLGAQTGQRILVVTTKYGVGPREITIT
jgi:hypothetical protein